MACEGRQLSQTPSCHAQGAGPAKQHSLTMGMKSTVEPSKATVRMSFSCHPACLRPRTRVMATDARRAVEPAENATLSHSKTCRRLAESCRAPTMLPTLMESSITDSSRMPLSVK